LNHSSPEKSLEGGSGGAGGETSKYASSAALQMALALSNPKFSLA
jgi:hypothetical protein